MDKIDMEPGLYRHYKGKNYEVIGVCRHTETLEPFVVYRALYESPGFGSDSLWVRPFDMFTGTVEYEGKNVLRFARISGVSGGANIRQGRVE